MWKYFMADALAGTADATIPRPPSVVSARIDPESGLMASGSNGGAIFEVFEAGRVPERQDAAAGPVYSGTGPGLGDEASIF
jgi:penicillin-binding protein 1A